MIGRRFSSVFGIAVVTLVIAGCSGSKGGAFYADDGPGRRPASDFVDAADAQPRDEPIVSTSTRPYSVFGKQYEPMKQRQPMVQTGTASWYGKKFHGRPTAIGETYDMYAMTAAHPTLPLPSYVRVLNRTNGKVVVVRVNDRGPFLNNRVIDLSFAAAAKLGFAAQGTAPVAVEVVDPMVVTLEAMRARRGLSTAGSVYDFPLLAASTVPAKPSGADREQADRTRLALNSASGTVRDTSNVAITDSTESRQADNGAAAASTGSPILTTAAPERVALATKKPEPASDAQPGPETKAPIEPAQPMAARAPRPVADVLLPLSPARSGAAAVQFVPDPAPEIKIEPFEGKGVRRARAERYKVPRKPPLDLAALNKPEKEKEFVIPYKDRLPRQAKGDEPKPRVYLQLGAYETEKAARQAMTEAGLSLSWLRQPVNVLTDRGLHKLQAGPFRTSRSARAVAKRIRSESAFSPFYVFR